MHSTHFLVQLWMLGIYQRCTQDWCSLSAMSANHHHHHHEQAPSWSVAVSMRCFQCSQSWVYFHAELRPRLRGWRSASSPVTSTLLFWNISWIWEEADAKKILTASSSPWRTAGDHWDAQVLCGWKPFSTTWNPITLPWMKQLMWCRIVHSGDWCLHLVLHTYACQKWWWWCHVMSDELDWASGAYIFTITAYIAAVKTNFQFTSNSRTNFLDLCFIQQGIEDHSLSHLLIINKC